MSSFSLHLENDSGRYHGDQSDRYGSVDRAVDDLARTAGAVMAEDVAAGRATIRIDAHVEDERGNRVASLTVRATVDRAS